MTKDPRTTVISARLTPGERDLLAGAAALRGETLSDLLRRAALAEAMRALDCLELDWSPGVDQ